MPDVPAVPAVPVPTPSELAEAIVRIEARLDALELAVTQRDAGRSDEVAKLAWAVKHGRQRPW